MAKDHAQKLLPLLNSQPDLHAELWQGQQVDYDLDAFRKIPFDFSKSHISRYQTYAFPEADPKLWEPWLQVEPDLAFKNTILVNRTRRYVNPSISYKKLAGRDDVVFVGLPDEHIQFSEDCHGIPHIEAPDFLTLARWIKACRLLVANQSFCFTLAEAMKTPRLLETFTPCPNAFPLGPNGADVIDQKGFDLRLARYL